MRRLLKTLGLIFLLINPTAVVQTAPAAPLTFTLTYDPAIADSFTGRVYVMLSTGNQEPRFGPAWFGTQPFFALDVDNWKPDTSLTFDDRAFSFPGPLSTLAEAEYAVQAVMRRNLDSPTIGEGEGTAYSAVIRHKLNGATARDIALRIDHVVPPKPFQETERIKLVELRSDLLSDFHGRDIIKRAAVILPEKYDAVIPAEAGIQPNDSPRRYPALYWIGGFGSDHRAARFMSRLWENTGFNDRIVRVVLDPLCYSGHHVFADSDNNGPHGRALIEEFIPHLERTYRLVSSPTARFLSGHSSGGWASLWLQITYPDFFGGCWSIAPDPVDFRDFQRIDLYAPGANMYVDEAGDRRPIARSGEHVLAWYEPFAKMEVVYGEGGQLRSFEWVFSPPVDAAAGRVTSVAMARPRLPTALYNRDTGSVDPAVAESWKRYDIRLILEQNWPALGPKLDGGRELRIFMGELDTFYLEGAVKLLKQSQETLGSQAVIELVAGRDHTTIATPALRQRIDRELLEIFNKAHPEYAQPMVYD